MKVSQSSKFGRRPGVSARLLGTLLEAMKHHGVDIDEVRRRVGIGPVGFGGERLPWSVMQRTWEEAVRVSGNAHLGVQIAAYIRPEMFDVIGYCVKHSATLVGVLERMMRYARIVDERFAWQLEVGDEVACLTLPHAPGPPFQPQYAECILTGIGLMGRRITGVHLVASEIRLTHSAPPHLEALSDAFDNTLRFDASVCALTFDRSYLSLPIPGHDAQLCEILERQADRLLEELPRQDPFVASVQSVIGSALSGGAVTAQEVAERLAVSETTLRRRLREADVNYQTLLDDVRFRLAQRLLRETSMDVAEVAFSTGFADPSSFSHAFKRWSGQTAIEYRRGKG